MEGAALAQGDADHGTLGGLGRLADCLRHLASLAVAEADAALLVADHDQGGEAEAPTALHHLGDAVDVDEAVDEFAVALLAVAAATASVSWFSSHFVSVSLARAAARSLHVDGNARRQNSRPPSRAASASALTRP
jgi:hypothetical protein